MSNDISKIPARLEEEVRRLGSPSAIARLMGKGKSTVYYWFEKGNIPAEEMRRWYFCLGWIVQKAGVTVAIRQEGWRAHCWLILSQGCAGRFWVLAGLFRRGFLDGGKLCR